MPKNTEISGVPEGRHTVSPRLVVRDGAAAIEFYRAAFDGAEVGERFTDPDGRIIHAEVVIGDSTVLITEETDDGAPTLAPPSLKGSVTAVMATYWPDVDSVWERALSAGAEVIYPLSDQFYGERSGRIRDPFGQQWMLSQRIEVVSADEMRRREAEYLG